MNGLRPQILILDRAQSDDELNRLEVENIRHFDGLGCRLTNLTDGGDGMSGYTHTEETRRRLAELQLGTKRPQQSGDRHWTARRATDQTLKAPGVKPRKIVCLNDSRVFDRGREAMDLYGISGPVPNRALHGATNRRGLRFRYLEG